VVFESGTSAIRQEAMSNFRVSTVLLLALLPVFDARAYPAIYGSSAPPGKWHWYHADFASVSFVPPIIHTGEATIDIVGSTLTTKLKLDPPDKDLHPFFRGKINAKNEVDGLFGGVYMEPQGSAPMHGLYKKTPWSKGGGCVTETITLQEKNFPENVLVFRRGTPAGC
jgi:hypothetical protein